MDSEIAMFLSLKSTGLGLNAGRCCGLVKDSRLDMVVSTGFIAIDQKDSSHGQPCSPSSSI